LRDFTLEKYELLIKQFLDFGYKLTGFSEYLLEEIKGTEHLILRHDIDKKPENALKMAKKEHELGVQSTYFFRITKNSFDEEIIKKIIKLGHEIGYHYEDLSMAEGNFEKAIDLFKHNLERLRRLYPVRTVCMHGRPLSKWDNREIWKKFDYRQYGIIGEPYLDLDFNKALYLTDTGRRWNGEKVSIRDKTNLHLHCIFRRTDDILRALQGNELPSEIMINIHPQRWDNNFFKWMAELIAQRIKNVLKFLLNIRLNRIARKR
jgi:hypothetical protein